MKIKQRNTYVTLCGKVGMFWLHTYHVHDIYTIHLPLPIGMSSMGTS